MTGSAIVEEKMSIFTSIAVQFGELAPDFALTLRYFFRDVDLHDHVKIAAFA